MEFSLTIPVENGGRDSFKFTENLATHVLSGLFDTVVGNNKYYHRFRTKSPEIVDKVLKSAMSDGFPAMLFRVGIGKSDTVQYLPWQRHTVTGYTGIVEGIGDETGHFFEITTQSQFWDWDSANYTTAHSGKISDIVRRIAEVNGIFGTVIEPTIGTGIYYQVYQGFADFIRKRLVQRAVNAKGHGNYQFFIRDNVVHFHTPEYHAEYKEMEFFNAGGQLLTVVDNSQKLILAGVSGCRLISYDPLTGTAKESVSDVTVATTYAESIYRMANLKLAQRIVPYHIGSNREAEAKAMCQSLYETARMFTFELSFKAAKIIHIRAGDIINLLLAPDATRVSSWSGLYYVSEVVTSVDHGAVEAKYKLQRGETRKVRTDAAVQSESGRGIDLATEHEAPGQPVNLMALQAAPLTKGQAYVGTDVRYAPVKDPNR